MVAVPAYPKLPVKRPVVIEWEPGTDRMLVLENLAWDTYKTTLKAFVDRPEASEMESLLEIPGDEEIAYSLCFHPRYRQNGFLYIGSNGKEPGDKHFSRIVRYTMSREARGRIVERSRLVTAGMYLMLRSNLDFLVGLERMIIDSTQDKHLAMHR